MNATHRLPLILSLGALGLGVWCLLRAPAASPAADARAPELAPALQALQGELSALRDTSSRQAEQLVALQKRLDERPLVSPGLSRDEVEEIAARLVEERASQRRAIENELAPPAPSAPPAVVALPAAEASAPPAKQGLDLAQTIARLRDPKLDHMEKAELWAQLRAAGQLDEAVAFYEQEAKKRPDDPQSYLELGDAYVQKIMEAGSGPLAGKWAIKADQQWDKALELDANNWDARFSKAVGLSFWPPVFGKQGEAIQQFETLVTQQEQVPAKPQFAQTYLLLGNMYQQNGDKYKAVMTWQKGLALFPGDKSLSAQIELAQKP